MSYTTLLTWEGLKSEFFSFLSSLFIYYAGLLQPEKENMLINHLFKARESPKLVMGSGKKKNKKKKHFLIIFAVYMDDSKRLLQIRV